MTSDATRSAAESPVPMCLGTFVEELRRTGDPERAGRLARAVQHALPFSVERESAEINWRMR